MGPLKSLNTLKNANKKDSFSFLTFVHEQKCHLHDSSRLLKPTSVIAFSDPRI